MGSILSAVVLLFAFRFRSRASLEIELMAVRHQLAVLRRQRPGRPQLSSLDRLLWVWLYRIWPQVTDAMVLVKPVTVVQWHRKGFRFYWRWRSRRPGRPKIGTEIRALIRRMSRANPLWGAPRIHGELLKLGIQISQAMVGRWMPWRPKVPSPPLALGMYLLPGGPHTCRYGLNIALTHNYLVSSRRRSQESERPYPLRHADCQCATSRMRQLEIMCSLTIAHSVNWASALCLFGSIQGE
jgi:hypothetical protein